MTLLNQLKQYVDEKDFGDPIFLSEVTRKFDRKNDEKFRNTISAYLNRLVRSDQLRKFDDGIFYKFRINVFGETHLNVSRLIKSTYLFDDVDQKVVGYQIGTQVLEAMGITNNLENKVTIVTNHFNRKKILSKVNSTIQLKKPVIKIDDLNYVYLQMLDTINEIEKYHIIEDDIGRKLVQFMKENEIEVNLLFQFAKKHYSHKTLEKLADFLAM